MSIPIFTEIFKNLNTEEIIKFVVSNDNTINFKYNKKLVNKNYIIQDCSLFTSKPNNQNYQDQYLLTIRFIHPENLQLTCYLTTWNTEKLYNTKNIILHLARSSIYNHGRITSFKILFQVIEDIISILLKAKTITYTTAGTTNNSYQRIILSALLSKEYKIINTFRNRNTGNIIRILYKEITRKKGNKSNVKTIRTTKTKSKRSIKK